MAVLLDARGNEFVGAVDLITGNLVTDARAVSASLGALNAESFIDLNGQATISYDLRSGAFTGTVSFEATIDGTNYFAVPVIVQSTQAVVTSIAGAGAVATNLLAAVAGYRRVRVRCSAYTSGTLTVAHRASLAQLPPSLETPYPTTTWVTGTAAANTTFTITLAAAGAGLFHYITHIDAYRNATAALAGTATLIYTTTNLPGSPAWSVGNAMAAGGTQQDIIADFSNPLKSSVANTATTLVVPAHGAAVLGRANVGYFVGA